MSPLFTVKAGGPEIEDGVYPVILLEIRGPKTVTAQRGPKAGQDIDLFDWTFAIDGGVLDGTTVDTSTSTASGPKSKMYSYLTALMGGKAPLVGASFEATDLVGRQALATIRKDDSGWPRIENLGAMPTTMRMPFPAAAAATTPAPVAAMAGVGLARPGTAVASDADLPF